MPVTLAPPARAALESIPEALQRVLEIDQAVLEPLVVAVLARGHVLIEGIPGTGKTLLARTLARVLGLLYFMNTIDHKDILERSRKALLYNAIPFVFFFLVFAVWLMIREGFAVNPERK